MTKLQRIAIVLAIALGLVVLGAVAGYQWCKSSQYKGVIKQQEKDAVDVLEHVEQSTQVHKNVDKVIETRIKKVVDASGCLDTTSPDDYIDGLLNADSTAQSIID